MTAQDGSVPAAGPSLRVAGRSVPVVLPKWGDPRLKLASVLITVQVLGQTVLQFQLSIAQILTSIGVCAAVDLTVTLWREHKLVWPASAMLTGNSVALLLRVSGTDHGDWWSLNGIHFFVLAALISLAVKYFVRPTGRHVFNPSNVGLVAVLLVFWPAGVFPQPLWWAPLGAPLLVTYAVLIGGAVWILRPLRMLPMVGAFMATFAVLVGILALAGNSFWALWHPQPVSGAFYWFNVVLSPEILVFVFFMMSDPRTAPRSRQGRVVFGVLTASVAAGLLAVHPTEFGVKLAVLASLTVTCALVPLIESAVARRAGAASPASREAAVPRSRWLVAVATPAVVAAALIALAAPVNTTRLADNPELRLMEQGLSGDADPQ